MAHSRKQADESGALAALELETNNVRRGHPAVVARNPSLYKLVTTIESGGKVADRTETEFGIRTVAFDAGQGFSLNGQPYEIKGTCNHQDHAGVGVGVAGRAPVFPRQQLKEMGCNAIRTSHNPPTPELLEACDRLGMLVMDESRALGTTPRTGDSKA